MSYHSFIPSPTSGMAGLFNLSQSSKYNVIWVSVCISLIINNGIFSCAYLPFICNLWWNICWNLLSFYTWIFFLLSYKHSLYILNEVLYQTYDLKIISPQFMAHLFIVFTVSLEEPKFLHLIKSNSSISFSFMNHAFGTVSKKTFAWAKVTKVFSYVFFYKFSNSRFYI